jgi:hypothetical protein
VRLAAVCGRADPPVHAYAEVAKKAAAAEAENKTSGDPAGDAEGAHQPIHRASRTGVCLAAVCGRADPQVHAYAEVAEDSDNFPNKHYLKPVYYALPEPVHAEHDPARGDERTFEQYTGQDGLTVDVLFSAAPPLVGQLCATLKTTKTKTKTTKTTETKTKTTETKTKTTKITKRKREQVCTNCRALHQ